MKLIFEGVTTPKLPPPHRMAQNKSSFSCLLASELSIGGHDVGDISCRRRVTCGR